MGLISSDKRFRLKLVTVLFYTSIPIFLALTLVEQGISRTTEISTIQVHLLLVIVAYYLFSTIEELKIKSTYNWSIIVHHVVFGIILLTIAINTNIPAYGLWAIAVQFSAIFVSIRTVLKAFPILYARFNPILETCDFVVFFVSRIVFQTLIMLILIIDIDPSGFICTGVVLSLYLNLFWFKQILMRRISKKQMILA